MSPKEERRAGIMEEGYVMRAAVREGHSRWQGCGQGKEWVGRKSPTLLSNSVDNKR